jgi:hypothetical protein
MDKDFIVGQANELIKGDITYDLHNCFDFDQLTIFGNGEFNLAFKPSVTYGDMYSPILLHAEGVNRFELSHNFGPATIKHLEEIGYKSRDDEDDNWLLRQSQATAADDIFFRFNDGHYVRFHSERAWLIERAEIKQWGLHRPVQ